MSHFSVKALNLVLDVQPLKTVVKAYNQVRKADGLVPVKENTVARYSRGMTGYEAGLPLHFRKYLISVLARNIHTKK